MVLAEDNEWNVETLMGNLEGRGFEVEVARDRVEALEKAKAFVPALVLMDVQMPRMDGLEAIRRLRADRQFDRMPIVELTAVAMPGEEERCAKAGADVFLSKPIGMKDLVATIDSLLERPGGS